MNIPIQNLDLVIASAATGLFVVPILYHLAANEAARPGRSFSLIPHKARRVGGVLVRLALIAGAAMISTEEGTSTATMVAWGCLMLTLLTLSVAGVTDRRLTIDAETGLVKWRKTSLPWWPAIWTGTGFVDKVRKVNFKSNEKKMNLLGVAKLAQHWTVNYNGNVSSSGHYSERTLEWIAEQVNDYLAAFRRHDTAAAREKRDLVRERLQVAKAPKRKRRAAREERARRTAAEKRRQREAKRQEHEAEKERARMRRLEGKFQR